MSVATFTPERSVLRLVPAPRCEPPYDDELPPPPPRTDGQATLELAFAPPPRALRLVRTPDVRPTDEERREPRRTPTAELPDARAWSHRLAQALAECVTGDRPLRQLIAYTELGVYEELAAAVAMAGRVGLARRRQQPRPVVSSVHVCEPADGVAEIAVTVRRGTRTQAIAARLEGVDGRWLCTAIHSR